MRTWYWLEDEYESVSDIDRHLQEQEDVLSSSIKLRAERTVGALTDHLLHRAQKEPDTLLNIGLLLDVLLVGNNMITQPMGWCGHERMYNHQTRDDYEAGLVLYEKLFLEHPLTPLKEAPPPVIILTIQDRKNADIEGRLARMREVWAERHGCAPDQAKVIWIRKTEIHEPPTLAEVLMRMERMDNNCPSPLRDTDRQCDPSECA